MTDNIKLLLDYFHQEARSFSGHFGLAAQAAGDAQPILFQAHEIFPTASVIKLAIVAEYLAQVAAGELTPDQLVTVRASDQVPGSGVLKDLRPDIQLSLYDIATLSITISDNTAANLLIEQVGGLARVNARIRALGMVNTNLGRPFFFFESEADNTGTPADFLRLLLAVVRGEIINPATSKQMLDMMRRQQYMNYIPRYLPYHQFAAEYGLEQTVTMANKVGMLSGTINDAAIITTPAVTFALVIFSRDCRDHRPDPDNEGALLIARLAKRIYDYFTTSLT